MSIIGGLFLIGAMTTTPAYQYIRSAETVALGTLHLAGTLLALFTEAVHLYLFFDHVTVTCSLPDSDSSAESSSSSPESHAGTRRSGNRLHVHPTRSLGHVGVPHLGIF